ncbi:hypothetical protein TWF694_010069 [Orbilia ellipsospora]|uniref:Rhodopsin domain-containing protein n=1 Tax=Orbilia ellipsospora TaxID=2528407 RepID=A0AAV9X958_9PEZI
MESIDFKTLNFPGLKLSTNVLLETTGNYSWNRPSDWPPMNTISPASRTPDLIALGATFSGLALITVVLRLYTRVRITNYMGWDDWFIMMAMAASFGMFGLQIAAGHAGWYHHIWDVPFEQFVVTKKIGLSIQSLYPWILGFIKISILLFYLRLSVSPAFRLVVYISLGFVSLYTVASSLGLLFQCWPFNTRLGDPLGSCVNVLALNYTIASLNIATDVFVYLLSWVMIRHLRVGTAQKVAVLAIFSIGALVCVFSGLRFYFLRGYWDSSDPTWDAFNVSSMSTLEANVAIMTSSVPAVKPLITHLFPNSKLLRTLPSTTEETYGRVLSTGHYTNSSGGNNKAIKKFLGGGPTGASYSTMTAVEHSIHHVRHLSDEDLGFPDGFDGRDGPPATNWDPVVPEPATPIQLTDPTESPSSASGAGITNQIETRAAPLHNDLDWIDKEISMATDGLDLESFKKGNMNARIDLVDALRGGPVGIIPDLRTPQLEIPEGHSKDLAEL